MNKLIFGFLLAFFFITSVCVISENLFDLKIYIGFVIY